MQTQQIRCGFESLLGEIYSIQHDVIQFVSDLWYIAVFPGTQVSFTNTTDRQDMTEILKEVALIITTLILTSHHSFCSFFM